MATFDACARSHIVKNHFRKSMFEENDKTKIYNKKSKMICRKKELDSGPKDEESQPVRGKRSDND